MSFTCCGGQVVHCSGALIAALLDAGAQHYLEFKLVQGEVRRPAAPNSPSACATIDALTLFSGRSTIMPQPAFMSSYNYCHPLVPLACLT